MNFPVTIGDWTICELVIDDYKITNTLHVFNANYNLFVSHSSTVAGGYSDKDAKAIAAWLTSDARKYLVSLTALTQSSDKDENFDLEPKMKFAFHQVMKIR